MLVSGGGWRRVACHSLRGAPAGGCGGLRIAPRFLARPLVACFERLTRAVAAVRQRLLLHAPKESSGVAFVSE
eukprot:7223335-Prymnesium_polylepis.2